MNGRLLTALLLGSLLSACTGETQTETLPPVDRFYFPVGIGITRIGGSATPKLLVASSNFDLRYSATRGGTILSVDADPSAYLPPLTAADVPLVVGGSELIGSYAGMVAIADSSTCPTLATTPGSAVVLVASRYDEGVYRLDLAADGTLSCGPDCFVPLSGHAHDPFAVTIACGPAGNRAYVGFLRTPDSTRGEGEAAWIAEVELDTDQRAVPARQLEIGDGSVRGLAYERATDRLWIAARPSGERSFLYSVVLSDPSWQGATPWEAVDAVDLYKFMSGLELKSLAIGSGPNRTLYATARLYDVETQTSNSGTRPTTDVGGIFWALDLSDDPTTGSPVAVPRKHVVLGTGPEEVAVVRRQDALGNPAPDVVIFTVLDGNSVWVYDDATGWAGEIGHDPADGLAMLGHQPVGIAVDQAADPSAPGATAEIYIGAFEDHLVKRFTLPLATPALRPSKAAIETIGGLDP